jgi:hypothetical protein
MEVTMTDGTCTASGVVLPGSIEVDVQNDIVRGTGFPGGVFTMFVSPSHRDKDNNPDFIFQDGMSEIMPENSPYYNPRFVVDGSGHWEVDLGAEGIDLTPECQVDVQFSVQIPTSGNNNRVFSCYLWPEFLDDNSLSLTTFLGLDFIIIENAGYSSQVNLTVRSEPEGEVLFTDTQTGNDVGDVLWGVAPYPTLGISLEPGMEVTAECLDRVTTGVIADLSIDNINQDTETISGIGPPGETLQLVIGTLIQQEVMDFRIAGVFPEILVSQEGAWQADLSGQTDIVNGMVVLVSPAGGNISSGVAARATVNPDVREENIATVEASDTEEVSVSTTSPDNSTVNVAIPAQTFSTGTTVRTAAITNKDDLIQQVAPPEGTNLIMGFTVGATGSGGEPVYDGFLNQVTLRFDIDASMLPPGTPPEDLKIAFWNGVKWTQVDGMEVTENPDGTVTLTACVDHFTVFSTVIDSVDAIAVGPANPLDEVMAFTSRSIGIDYSRTYSKILKKEELYMKGNGSSAGLILIYVACGLLAVILVGITYSRMKARKAGVN